MAEAQEKRTDPRLPLILQVEYPDQGRTLRDTTENLSAGGFFIRTERVLAVGERLPLKISFPGLLPPITIEVEVVRHRRAGEGGPPGVAVRVPSDRPEDRRTLARLAASGGEPAGVAARTYRILVVEDNPLVMEMFQYALRRLGTTDGSPLDIQIRFASNGHEALASICEHRPDLLMTDLYMPVMDGFTLVEKMRADPGNAGMPVLVVSAGGDDARHKAQELGVDVFLHKPVQFAELIGTLRLLLGRT
jgi:uncharacterized protein (TIGR02266 family)